MTTTRLVAQIRAAEGYRPTPFQNTNGIWVAGWGHVLNPEQIPEHFKTFGRLLNWLSARETHEAWFEDDLGLAIVNARRFCRGKFDSLTDIRQDVMVELAFHLGPTNLAMLNDFRGAMLRDYWASASQKMLDTDWAQQTPSRAERLAQAFVSG